MRAVIILLAFTSLAQAAPDRQPLGPEQPPYDWTVFGTWRNGGVIIVVGHAEDGSMRVVATDLNGGPCRSYNANAYIHHGFLMVTFEMQTVDGGIWVGKYWVNNFGDLVGWYCLSSEIDVDGESLAPRYEKWTRNQREKK